MFEDCRRAYGLRNWSSVSSGVRDPQRVLLICRLDHLIKGSGRDLKLALHFDLGNLVVSSPQRNYVSWWIVHNVEMKNGRASMRGEIGIVLLLLPSF